MAKIRYNGIMVTGIIVDYNQLIKKQKQEVKKKISKIRKIIPPSNYTQENERCHMCWDPNTYEVNSCPYCYSSYEKTVIKNKKHDNEKNYQSDCAVKKVKVYDGSVNEDSIDNIYDNDPNFESDFESEKTWSIVNIDNWSTEKKKHENEKNYQSDCVVKKVKVHDGSINEGSIDNFYDNDTNFESDFESEKIWSIVNIDNWSKEKKKHDNEKNYQSDSVTKKVKVHDRGVNDLNSESDFESDSDIGQFFVFQSIDEIKKQEAVDRLLKVSNEAEELCQVVNEINVYDNKVNEIKVQNEITKKGRIFQEIKLTSDQIIKKKSKISGKKKMKKVLESFSNESSSKNEEIKRKNIYGEGKLRPDQKSKSSKQSNHSNALTNFICNQCKFIAIDSPTLESHQLFNH